MYERHQTAFNGPMNSTTQHNESTLITAELISRTLAKRSFCTLATTSKNSRPHVAGVVYALVDGVLYISTTRTSRKARNILENRNVFVCVPVRRMPFGAPPSTIQFASTATILPTDHPSIIEGVREGRLKRITSHGEIEMPDGCFIRIEAPATYLTYGLGMSLRDLARDPLNAGGRLIVREPPTRLAATVKPSARPERQAR
jgi:general stress protein 26